MSEAESLEGSMLRSPWVTVCNVLWGNRLAATQHSVGSKPIPFATLWPGVNSFIDLYNHGGMETSVYEIVKLLIASRTFEPLDAMLGNRLIAWDMQFPGNVTLAHLVCAFNSYEGCERLIKDCPQKDVWEIKDHLDHKPFSVCYSPELRKHLRKNIKALSKHSKSPVISEKALTPEIRSQIFHLASESEGLYDMAVLLQMYDFDINQEKNDDGDLLLHIVASGGLPCLAHVFYLVYYYKADITLPNDDGLTPVHIAAKIGDEKLTELLICVFGAGVNSTDTAKKWTPLHFAARYNRPQLIDMLLERGADLRKDDSDGCIPALVAQKHSSMECLSLLEHHSKGRDERLIQEASQGTLNVHKLYPSDLSLVTKDGFTLLMKAVLGNQPLVVRDLLSKASCPVDFKQFRLPGPNEMPSIQEQSQKTALAMAAENGLINCLRVLLEGDVVRADPSILDGRQMLPLHYAVENNHKDCVRCILNHEKGMSGLKLAASLAEKNGRGDIEHIIKEAMSRRQKEVVNPALFDIARNGDKDSLFQLLEDGDDVNPSNDVSDWPLYVAAGFGHVQIVKLLHESGGSVVKRHRLNLCTPLHAAARGGHTEVLRFLLGFCRPAGSLLTDQQSFDPNQSYLDVNEKNAMQETPLELAACQGHMNVVRILLDHGAVTTLPDSNGCLLSCPAFCGIQFLIESRRKEQMDKMSRYLNEQKSLKDFCTIWKGPSDFNLRDSHGDTVLMVAAKYAKPDVMDFLLQSAVLYTPDMKIKWNYTKRRHRPPPSRTDLLEESLPSEMPSRRRDDYRDYRPSTAFESSMRRSRGGSQTFRPNGYATTDTSEDDDLSLSGNYQHTRHALSTRERPPPQIDVRPRNDPPPANNYINVSLLGTGPCTQSGLLCLVNTYDKCSALHRAVEGNQFKLIPLLLTADPNIANIQDKRGQSALHWACHQNLKKCILALINSSVVCIDPMLRDVNNKLAEDLIIQPRLKKAVYNYRVKRVKENHPTNRPLPPAPTEEIFTNGVSELPLEDPLNYTDPPHNTPIRRNGYQHLRLTVEPLSHAQQQTNNNHQYNHLSPGRISSRIVEEDQSDDSNPPSSSNQPRYISTPRGDQHPQPPSTRMAQYSRVKPRSTQRGSVSDDGHNYSRLIRYGGNSSPPPPIPQQNFTPPLPNQSRDSLSRRVDNLRGVAYDDSDSYNEESSS